MCFYLEGIHTVYWTREEEFELVDDLESEVVVVRDEDVVCEEFVTFFDEFTFFSVFLTVSRVGFSALLSQVMSVWVSTEVKTGLVTLAYDF